jgi:hypothetical protein
MFNYYNLNDVEFENLCQDVMERMLSVKLRCFAKGRDGGIDLTDNTLNYNIVVQVKHYIRSKFQNLRTALNSEIPKVEKWNPNKYYICCGMELTASNISEIYGMFSSYMESDRNIVTLKEIDSFLQKPENADIVRRHYKLWLYASEILSQIYNQNIFIDCESLLYEIEEESKFFVQTEIYNRCLDCLDKHRMIMITGQPGVGKTITSKMLTLYYATQGYAVRYTTNGEISDIKKALSADKDAKEILLLDDCLGQHYFNMKETQENELTSLAQYIKLHENKKLILNSRVTILNEAMERSKSFSDFIEEKKLNKFTINMDTIHQIEKARIFYNHLIFKNVPRAYYENIKTNKHYLKIVMHSNYTPRIIEYVTLSSNYLKISPEGFAEYVLANLNNPNDIWKDEYYQRIKEEDRALLTTLYSLTDTAIDYDILKKCFNSRLSQMRGIDYTLNNFEAVLARLNQSIIKITDNKGKMQIGVINPSVNDFLKSVYLQNDLEISEIRKSIVNILQIKRCYKESEIAQVIDGMLNDGSILDIDFNFLAEKDYFITSHICSKRLLYARYQATIFSYLQNSFGIIIASAEKLLSHNDILSSLLVEPFLKYYEIADILDERLIEYMLLDLDLEDLISTINILGKYFEVNDNESLYHFIEICKASTEKAIVDYIESTPITDYCGNYDVRSLISEYTVLNEYGVEVDVEAVSEAIKEQIIDDLHDEITEKLDDLFDGELASIKIPEINIGTSEISSVVNSYFEPDYDDDFRYEGHEDAPESFENAISIIFER